MKSETQKQITLTSEQYPTQFTFNNTSSEFNSQNRVKIISSKAKILATHLTFRIQLIRLPQYY